MTSPNETAARGSGRAGARVGGRHAVRRGIPAPKFRRDFEGFRGWGTLVVVLAHAGVPIHGGYIALDIFFAVSGFLITWQIVAAHQNGTFSFWEFYTRRVRRLLPAAIVTTAATVILFALLLPPYRAAEAARESTWATLSLANVFFAAHGGYWSLGAIYEPLLHMWSLSVEEQFYLIWPITVTAIIMVMRSKAWIGIVVITVVSIVFTTLSTPHHPEDAYLLTHFRAYEFSFGALAVWLAQIKWSRASRLVMWLAGVGLLVFAVSTFDETMAYPGFIALAPSIGGALVIISHLDFGPSWVMTNPVMVHLGTISYSLYLVHWPILVAANSLVGNLHWPVATVSLLIALVVGEALHRFVEVPMRSHRAGDQRVSTEAPGARRFFRLAGPVLAAGALVAGASVAAASYYDKPDRYEAEVQPVIKLAATGIGDTRKVDLTEICKQGREASTVCGTIQPGRYNVLIVGDSLAIDTLNVTRAAHPEANLLIATKPGCGPWSNLYRYDPICDRLNKVRLAQVAALAPHVDEVVIGAGFEPNRIEPLLALIGRMKDLGAPSVTVFGLGPEYRPMAWEVVAAAGVHGANRALWEASTVTPAENAHVRGQVEAAGANYVDRLGLICGSSTCRAFVGGQHLLFFDSGHMTPAGAAWLGRQLRVLHGAV